LSDVGWRLSVDWPAVAGVITGVLFGGVLLVAPRLWLDACREYGPSWVQTSSLFDGQRTLWVRVMGGLMVAISLAVLWGMLRVTLAAP
jgi:hypothetical protein